MVPLTIPVTRSICSPASVSASGRMMGMPPPTAASNSSGTPVPLGGGDQLRPAGGDQLLVGGDHRLARLQGGEHEVAGRVATTHHLDDERHLGVG